MFVTEIERLHVPQLCECDSHKKEFNKGVINCEFSSFKDMMESVIKWNTSQNCWVYRLLKYKVQ